MGRVFLVGPGGLAGEWGRQPVPLSVSAGASVGAGAGVGFGHGPGLAAELCVGVGERGLESMHLHPPIEVTAPSPDNALEGYEELGQTLIASSNPSHPNQDPNENQLNQLDVKPNAQASEQTVALVHREAELTG